MKITAKRIVIGIAILVIGIVLGLVIPALIKKQEDFDTYVKARDAATDKVEFDKNFDNMIKWFDDYKRDHPGSTDADAQRAFDDIWNQSK